MTAYTTTLEELMASGWVNAPGLREDNYDPEWTWLDRTDPDNREADNGFSFSDGYPMSREEAEALIAAQAAGVDLFAIHVSRLNQAGYYPVPVTMLDNHNTTKTYFIGLPDLMRDGWIYAPGFRDNRANPNPDGEPDDGFSFSRGYPMSLEIAKQLISEHDNGLDLAKVYLGEIAGPAWMKAKGWSK